MSKPKNKRSTVSKICETCACPYFPTIQTFDRSKYCCLQCKKRARRTIPLYCLYCEKEFFPLRFIGRLPKFCQRRCSAKYQDEHHRPSNFHGVKKTEAEKIARRESGKFAGQNNGRWNGGRYTVKQNGHVWVRVATGTYRAEHAVVAEQKLGRPLKKGEIPHHVNMNTADNSPPNIFICASRAIHAKIHAEYGRLLVNLVSHSELVAIAERIQNEYLALRETVIR